MPKTLKDENAPKRPLSGYMEWLNSVRDEIVDEIGENQEVTKVFKVAGERWQQMDDDEKEPWNKKAARSKKKYEKALAAYKETEEYMDFEQRKFDHDNKQMLKAVEEPADKPKRPLSGYMRFAAKERPKLNAEGITAVAEMGKAIGKRWAKLSDAEKDKWQALYKDEMELYNEELEAWKDTDEYAEYQEKLKAVKDKIARKKRKRSREMSEEEEDDEETEPVERPKKKRKTSTSRSRSRSKSKGKGKGKGKKMKGKRSKAKGKRSRSRSKAKGKGKKGRSQK